MNKTAIVIVTYDCNRKCENCFNKCIENIPKVRFEDLLKYKEIVISGGEPMIIGDQVVELIHRLKDSGYKGMIWIYTSDLRIGRWPDKAVLREVNGITYTLHYEYTQNDISNLKRLSSYLLKIDTTNMHNQLIIDLRLINEFDWEDIIPKMGIDSWDCIRWLNLKDEKLPEMSDKELLFYDLQNDNFMEN